MYILLCMNGNKLCNFVLRSPLACTYFNRMTFIYLFNVDLWLVAKALYLVFCLQSVKSSLQRELLKCHLMLKPLYFVSPFFRTFWAISIIASLFMLVYIIVDVAVKRPENLQSLAGIVFFISVLYAFSYNPGKVRLHLLILYIFKHWAPDLLSRLTSKQISMQQFHRTVRSI